MRRGFWWYCPPEGKCALAARARARESTGSNRTPRTQGCKRMCRIQRGRRRDRGIGEGRHARSSPRLPNLQHRGKSRPDTRRGPSSCWDTRPPSNRCQRSLSCMHTCHCGSSHGTSSRSGSGGLSNQAVGRHPHTCTAHRRTRRAPSNHSGTRRANNRHPRNQGSTHTCHCGSSHGRGGSNHART